MSGRAGDRLYALLPAIHRIRDAGEGEPLRALLRVMERELVGLEADLEGLYESWFIETCDEWVVPYIGDLLGVRGIEPLDPEVFTFRAFVANTLRYRRRKGTAAVLEQIARDLTGWPARAVELFERLVATRHASHPRPGGPAVASLRNAAGLELFGGPFEEAAHTVEVRRIASGRGRYNIPNVALFLWRLQAYPVERSTARAAADPPDGRYRFHPAGLDAPLFNPPRTEEEITHLAEEVNVPAPLRRRPLHAELEARRRPWRREDRREDLPEARFFTAAGEPFRVVLDGGGRAVPAEEILICDLADRDDGSWPRPPATRTYRRPAPTESDPAREETVTCPVTVAVDPVRGRLAFPAGAAEPGRVEVSYSYGFSGDLGGGPYDRRGSVEAALPGPVDWQIAVLRGADPGDGREVSTLGEAVRAWNDREPGTVGVIAVGDSGTYPENLTGGEAVRVPEGSTLVLTAARWPESANGSRRPGVLRPDGLRPHLLGDLSVDGTAGPDSERPGTLVIDGLLIEGRLRVLSGNLGRLVLSHCTLLPGERGLVARAGAESNRRLRIEIRYSIVARVLLGETGIPLAVSDSLIDRRGRFAVRAPGSAVTIEGSTILGRVEAERLDADGSLFLRPVEALRRQEGCLRFSFVPPGSRTPRRYRCQPDLEIEERTERAEGLAAEGGGKLSDADRRAIRERTVAELVPTLTSLRYGDPGYGQLARVTPEAIRAGAEDGSEMGAFRHLQQSRREANLRRVLAEYLRFGLEAGIFFAS